MYPFMAHKKKMSKTGDDRPVYTIEDALQVTDEVFNLTKENKYHPGAFIHGLVIALEYTQMMYNIPPQQIANIKRGSRKYLKEIAQRQNVKEKIK